MATDFGEKERAFIDGLKENTGSRSLRVDAGDRRLGPRAAQRHHRLAAPQGAHVLRASWLERIHHNGGKPIYADAPKDAPRSRPRRRREGVLVAPLPVASPAAEPPAPVAPPPASVPAPVGDVDALLAKAKAYRPLAQHVLAQIKSVRPAANFTARESAIAIGDPNVFAALGISAKELRLHLALGEHPFDDVVRKGQAGGGLGKGEALYPHAGADGRAPDRPALVGTRRSCQGHRLSTKHRIA